MIIRVSNLYAVIENATLDEIRLVKATLFFQKKIKSYLKRPLIQTTKLHFVVDGKIAFFRGILNEVVSILRSYTEVEVIQEEMRVINPYNVGKMIKATENLRPYQQEAFDKALDAQRGIWWLCTNAGKTEIAASLLKYLCDYKFLFVTHRKELCEQTYERFKKLGVDAGVLSAERTEMDNPCTIVMMQTLYSRTRQYKDWLQKIDGVIWDECHHAGAQTANEIMCSLPKAVFRLGLTGTMPEDEAGRWPIQQFFGPVCARVTNDALIKAGYSSGIKIVVIKGEWGDSGVGITIRNAVMAERAGKRINIFQEATNAGIVRNDGRNRIIAALMAKLRSEKKTGVMVFVDYLEHGQLLSELSNAPFISSESLERSDLFQSFKSGVIPMLITSPILDEGVDVSRIHHIIFASGKKGKIKILQRIGRGLRKEEGKECVELYDFYDSEVPMLRKHSDERIETYFDEGFSVDFVELRELLPAL